MIAFLLIGCLSGGPTNDTATSDARITTTHTLTEHGVEVEFTLDVPDGARNVELWFGDGSSVRDDLSPVHTYLNNAAYQPTVFWDDDSMGGRETVELLIDEVPLPELTLDLPPIDGTLLIAVNHYGFLPNYTANEPSHTFLYGSGAMAWEQHEGAAAPLPQAAIDFYSNTSETPRRVSLTPDGDRSTADLLGEAHTKIPSWFSGETLLHEGGFTMPTLDRTDAPELNIDAFLQNAHHSASTDLELGLRLRATGAAHGLHYTLVGPEGVLQVEASAPSGLGLVTIPAADLAQLGLGVVGVYATLYSDISTDGQLVRSAKVGYMPLWLDE